MYIVVRAKCPLFLSDFNETWIFSVNFRKIILEYEISWNSVMFHADRRTDMTKLIVALHKFTNALRNRMRNLYKLLWQEMDLIASLIPNVCVFCSYILEVFCFLYDCTSQTKDASDWLNFHYMPISCHQEYGTNFEMCSWLSRDSYLFRPSCLCLCTIFQTELSTFLKKRQISWLNL
jgi:hypothetical protein